MKKIHYAWVVAAVTFICLIVSAAVRSTPSVLIVPLEREFGWSASAISVAISINILLYGLMGPFAAGVINRYGLRRVMLVAFAVVGTGAALSSVMQSTWQMALFWGVIVGSGTGMVAIVLGATVVNRWFHTRRGLVLGMLTASSATGQLLFLPFLAYMAEHHGWRSAIYIIIGALLLLVPFVILFMRDDPADAGTRPFGLADDAPLPSHSKRNPIGEAFETLAIGMRSRDFWLLAGSFFVCGASTNGLIGTHLIPACVDHGMTEVQGAGLLAMMGIFDLLGTTASGWLSDRFNNRVLLASYYGLRGLSLIYLPAAFDPSSHKLSLFAVFYGLDWIATVPPTVALANEIFGRTRGPIAFGWVLVAHQIGAAAAASMAGFIRTHDGSYDHAFLISGSICIATALCVFAIGHGEARTGPRDTAVVASAT